MSARAEQRIGQVIDRYRIEALLGEGGFGAVYRAKHVVMGRDVALKLLHAGTERDDDTRERFLREAQAAAAVGHRSIVQVFDCGITQDGTAFIAMELLQGEDLEQHLQKHGAVSRQRALQIIVDLLDALEAAHHAGVVHRDLKPANVFLTGGEIKILDFGISQMRGKGIKNLTQTGMVMGTPHYMAPETFRGIADVDARADLYAVGAMLYQLIAGHPPHDAPSYEQLVVRVATLPAPPILEAVPDLPPGLARLVDHALAANPEERWSDARAFREALLPFATGADTGPIHPTMEDVAAPAMTPAWGMNPAPAPSPLAPSPLSPSPVASSSITPGSSGAMAPDAIRPSGRPPADPLAETGFAGQAETPAPQALAPSAHPPAMKKKGPVIAAAVLGTLLVATITMVIALAPGGDASASRETTPVSPSAPAVPPQPAVPPEAEQEATTIPDKPEELVADNQPIRPEAPPPAAPPPPSLAPPVVPTPATPTTPSVTTVRVDLVSAVGLPRAPALRFGDAAASNVMRCARSTPHVVRVMMMVGQGGEINIAQPDPNEEHGNDVVARCVASRMGAEVMHGVDHGIAVYRVELPAR